MYLDSLLAFSGHPAPYASSACDHTAYDDAPSFVIADVLVASHGANEARAALS